MRSNERVQFKAQHVGPILAMAVRIALGLGLFAAASDPSEARSSSNALDDTPDQTRSQQSSASPELLPIDQIGGASHALVVDPPGLGAAYSLFVGHGPRVQAYAGALPGARAALRGQSPLLSGVVQGLALGPAGLVVAADRGGLQVLDPLQPGLPLRGALALGGESLDVALRGDLALVARAEQGLDLVDLSRATSPRLLSHLDLAAGAQAMSLAIVDDMGLVAAGVTGLHLIDLSNPERPREIGRLDRADGFPVFLESVAAAGDLAAVGDGPRTHVIDLRQPSSPRVIATIEHAGASARALSIEGDRLAITLVDDLDASGALRVFDLGDPSAPRALGGLDLAAEGIPSGVFETPRPRLGIDLAGGAAFVAAGGRGLRTAPAWERGTPRLAETVEELAWPEAVAVLGPQVYVAAGAAGLQVLRPDAEGRLQPILELDSPGYARDVAVRSHDVYVADESGGIRHFIVAAPGEPPGPGPAREIDALESLRAASRLALGQDHLYVADGLAGLRIVALHEPGGMRDIGGIDLGFDFVEGLSIDPSGRRLLVARGSGVSVYDLSDEAAPQLLMRQQTPGFAQDVLAWGEDLLVAEGESGITRLIGALGEAGDIQVEQLNTPGTAWSLDGLPDAEGSGALFVADGESGVRLIHIDAAGLSLGPGFGLPREAVAMTADGAGGAYVAARGSGIWRFGPTDGSGETDTRVYLPLLRRGEAP